MPKNIDPVYPDVGIQANNLLAGTAMNQLILNGSTDYTGIDADTTLVCTASADGSYVESLRFKAGGTNTASCARIYINNGSTPTTAANNTFWGEVSLPATTAIATAATAEIVYPMGIMLQPNFRIYFALATAVAAGWNCNAVLGDF